MTERRDRPDELHGTTQRINTGYGKVYVNINFDENGDPFEVFVNMGDSGGFTNSMCEMAGKTISNALRAGIDAEVIADDLLMIRSPKIEPDNGDWIYSIPDAIGVALKRAITDSYAEPVRGDALSDSDPEPPEGEQLMFEPGGGGDAP